MHNGESCEVYQEPKRLEEHTSRAQENEASEREVTATSKQWTNCGALFQKSDGYDHFTCEPSPS